MANALPIPPISIDGPVYRSNMTHATRYNWVIAVAATNNTNVPASAGTSLELELLGTVGLELAE